MSVGDNIRAIRKEKKLTQKELAKKMKISRSYLSDIENNRKNPSTKTLQSLSEKLNVTMLYLTTGKKAISDLSDDERVENFKNFKEDMKKRNEKSKEYLKEELKRMSSAELGIVETLYLINAITYLKHSDEDDVAHLAAIIRMLNSAHETNDDEHVTQEEIKNFIDGEMKHIREFLEKRFNYNKEGD